jgi:iron complex outermembrane receptor protein
MQTFAEQSDPNKQEDFFEMSIEDLMDIEVVSVSRRAQKITQSSAQVAVITAEDIHYSGLTNIPEVLRLAPGVDVQRLDRNRYAVSVRGFQGRFSDRILVLINGRSAGNPVLAGINWESFPVLMEDIERIEIVRGPGGAAWGANAENGVINIITKKPVDTEGAFFATTINEYGDSYTHARFSQISDLWSWRLSAGYEDLENSDDAGAGKQVSAEPAFNGLIGFDSYKARDFSRNWRFDFEARYQYSDDTELSFGAAYSNLEMGDSEFAGFYPMKDYQTNHTRLFSRIDHEFDDGSTGYIQWFGNYFVSEAPNIVKRYSYLENDFEAQYNLVPVAGHEISLGGNIRLAHIDTTNGPDIEEMLFHNDPYNEYWFGLFITDRFALTDRWTIENQVRADWYSETDLDWSLRSSALYGLDEAKDHMLRFSFARAFRSPAVGLRETTASYLGGMFNSLQPAKDLVNEEIWSLEGGYTGLFDNGLSINFNSYYQRYENILGLDLQTGAFGETNATFANNDGADAYGAEVEVAVTNKKCRIAAWYAYNALSTDNFNENIRAAYPAEHKAGLNARLFLSDGFAFNANYTYYNSIHHFDNIFVDTPISHRLDLTLSKKIAKGKGEIMIGVSDVLNSTSGPVFGTGDLTAYETPGRTFFARLQANF